jgi:hypothetical protein
VNATLNYIQNAQLNLLKPTGYTTYHQV